MGAITDLLSLAQTDIRRYARRSCRNHSDAEEAVQETLIVLYRKVDTLRQVGGDLRMALSDRQSQLHPADHAPRRVCPSPRRRKPSIAGSQERRRTSSGSTSPGASSPSRRTNREIVVLRDMEELTIDEIAEKLGTTRETVKARLHRARGLLREYLDGGR